MSYLVKVSNKGQITIPVKEKTKFKNNQLLLESKGNLLVLRPVKIVPEEDIDNTKNFGALSLSSFEKIWSDPSDDVYDTFYSKKS